MNELLGAEWAVGETKIGKVSHVEPVTMDLFIQYRDLQVVSVKSAIHRGIIHLFPSSVAALLMYCSIKLGLGLYSKVSITVGAMFLIALWSANSFINESQYFVPPILNIAGGCAADNIQSGWRVLLLLYQADSITVNTVQLMPVYKSLVEEATTEET